MSSQNSISVLDSPAHARRGRPQAAFTMIEIALCLAIIGFALIAIIGSLPIGLGVQKNNREETIINQDAEVWVDAIRNGTIGYDDLTNYVLTITNYWSTYNRANPVPGTAPTTRGQDWFTTTGSKISSQWILNRGSTIVGLLSTPQLVSPPPFGRAGAMQSNYIVAYVRAMSGAAVEKPPQSNPDIMDSAFAYRMIVENVALPVYSFGTNDLALANNLRANARELRLTFRYPVLPRTTGNGRLTFRTLVGGTVTNLSPLYFYQPSLYVQAP